MSASTAFNLPSPHAGSQHLLALDTEACFALSPILLTPGEWSVGSSSECRIKLSAADVADVHAHFVVTAECVVVRAWALNTRLNGAAFEQAMLSAEDVLEIGSVSLRVRDAQPIEIFDQLPRTETHRTSGVRSVSSEQLLRRISEIAESLDGLERELHSEQAAGDKLDLLITKIQSSLAKSTSKPSAQTTAPTSQCDQSIRSIRQQLDQLDAALQNDLETAISRIQVPPQTDSATSRERARLDQVLAQVQPAESHLDDAWALHGEVSQRMTRQLSLLVDFTQQLCSRAAVLDVEASDLFCQRDQLQHDRQELEVVRVQLGQEREVLELQRELLDSETENFNRSAARAHGGGDDSGGQLWAQDDLDLAGRTPSLLEHDASFESTDDPFESSLHGADDSSSGHNELGKNSNWLLDEPSSDWSLNEPDIRNAEQSLEQNLPELQRLVAEIEHDSENADNDTVDEIPVGSLDQSIAELPILGAVFDPASATRTRDDAVAELDALLAAYACLEEGSPLSEPEISATQLEDQSFQDKSPTDSISSLPEESTLELETGETWYGQPLEGDSEIEAAQAVEAVEAELAVLEAEAAFEADLLEVAERESAVEHSNFAPSSEDIAEEAFGEDVEASLAANIDDEATSFAEVEALEEAEALAELAMESLPDFSVGERLDLDRSQVPHGDRSAEAPLSVLSCDDVAEQNLGSSDSELASSSGAWERVRQTADSGTFLEEVASSESHSNDLLAADEAAPEEALSDELAGTTKAEEATSGGMFGANAEVELPTGSLLAQFERTPVAAEETKLTELRSQLADLFGIKHAPAAPVEPVVGQRLEDRFQSFYSGGKSIEELDQNGSLEEPRSPILDEASDTKSEVPSGASCSVAKTGLAETNASVSTEADDPIRAYMDQLLARNKLMLPKAEPVLAPASEGQSTVEELSTLMSEALPAKKLTDQDYSWLSEGPKHKQDKEEVRANMNRLRQLANMQARTAVVRASRKQLRMQVMAKSAAATMALIFGGIALVMKVAPIFGYLVCGLGVMFAADLVITVVRNWRTLSKQSQLVRESSDADHRDLKSNPRTEGRLEQFTKASRSAE